MIGPSQETLVFMGAKVTSLILNGEWWRIFISMFLHAGVLHYVFNMATMWILGSALEKNFGMGTVAMLVST